MLKQLRCLNVRTAAGYDKIPPKLLKIGADSLCVPLQYLINMSIRTSSFPTNLKNAEVTPIYKKKRFARQGKLQTCKYTAMYL